MARRWIMGAAVVVNDMLARSFKRSARAEKDEDVVVSALEVWCKTARLLTRESVCM
jgi:hypothetical protein